MSALNKVLELRTDNPELYCNVATYFEELGEELAVPIGQHSSSQYIIYYVHVKIPVYVHNNNHLTYFKWGITYVAIKLLFRIPTDKYIHDLQRNLNNTNQ